MAGLLARMTLGCALLTLCSAFANAQQTPVRLKSDQIVTLHGKLRVKFRGFFSYLLIDTGTTYLADGGRDEGTKKIRLIEIRSNGNQSLLAKHAGEMITVRGKLFVEFAAPVPYNGVQLDDTEVTLPDGTNLLPQPEESSSASPNLPPKLQQYMFTRTLIPNRIEGFPDVAIDLGTGRPLLEGGPGNCVMSGAQDFMTCSCAQGFIPVRGGIVQRPLPASRWQAVPKPESVWKDMRAAQFAIPEEVPKHPIYIQLVCKRGEIQ